jgi:hypothetical protein
MKTERAGRRSHGAIFQTKHLDDQLNAAPSQFRSPNNYAEADAMEWASLLVDCHHLQRRIALREAGIMGGPA